MCNDVPGQTEVGDILLPPPEGIYSYGHRSKEEMFAARILWLWFPPPPKKKLIVIIIISIRIWEHGRETHIQLPQLCVPFSPIPML